MSLQAEVALVEEAVALVLMEGLAVLLAPAPEEAALTALQGQLKALVAQAQ